MIFCKTLLLLVTVRIYEDTVIKEPTVYSMRKDNLCVKIAHALTKLIAISALGGTDRADSRGGDLCSLTGPHTLQGLHLVSGSPATVLKFLSLEQGAFRFHCVLDFANYVAGYG